MNIVSSNSIASVPSFMPKASSKLKVGMVQINNSFSGQNYFPYSVAILQAFANKQPGIAERFDFLLPVYLRESITKTVDRLEGADYVFVSAYVWNFRQSIEVAKEIKRRNPKTIVIFGGPQVPDRGKQFHENFPFIDAAVHGEGEQAFVKLLEFDYERALERDFGDLGSVSYINKEGVIIQNPNLPRIKNIEEVPSPYLTGVFDPVMKANPNERWIVMWETNRGCPFSCAYCDWGSATQSRVFKFELDRLYKEVDWFAQNKIEYIFCADANFGMLPRDLELAQYLAKKKSETGYPHAVSVQNTKNSTERAYQVQKVLSDAGLNKGVTIALQSADPQTLKNIKRSNISTESFQELQRRFTKDGVETYTDIILALPGETYESFTDGISTIVENGQHNRIQFGNLAILPNAAMADPAYMEEHGLELMENEIVNFHGSLEDSNNEILERQSLVVATKTTPREDWVKTRVFAYYCSFLYFNKPLQIPMLLLVLHFNIRFKDLVKLFADRDLADYPVLREVQQAFRKQAVGIQNGSAEYTASTKWLNIWWPIDELQLIEICTEGKIDAFYKEAQDLISTYLKAQMINVPKKLLDDMFLLNKALLKLPMQTEDLKLNLSYNIWEAYQAGRANEIVPLIEKPVTYVVDRTSKTWDSWERWCREVIWWGNKKGAYLYTNMKPQVEISGHY